MFPRHGETLRLRRASMCRKGEEVGDGVHVQRYLHYCQWTTRTDKLQSGGEPYLPSNLSSKLSSSVVRCFVELDRSTFLVSTESTACSPFVISSAIFCRSCLKQNGVEVRCRRQMFAASRESKRLMCVSEILPAQVASHSQHDLQPPKTLPHAHHRPPRLWRTSLVTCRS
jgi:hypothetical protein